MARQMELHPEKPPILLVAGERKFRKSNWPGFIDLYDT